MWKLRFLVLWLSCLWVVAVGAQERYTFTHPQMGTEFRIILYADSDILAQTAARAAFDTLDALNARLSDYDSESELSRLSGLDSGRVVEVSRPLWEVVWQSQALSAHSQGAFDLTIGPLSKLWRRAFRQQRFPGVDRIEEARTQVGYQGIQVLPGQRLQLLRSGVKLDAGGIAKGFAVDAMMEVLLAHGIQSSLVDGGGDIRVTSPPPDAPGWAIQVQQMDSLGQSQSVTLHLAHCAIATSGDYYRYLSWEGQRYSHIIDPRNGLGVQHGAQVTVLCSDCATADALASAISVMGPGADWGGLLRVYPDCEGWVVRKLE
ncbi:MAG: FAD:protein FMN transferase [Phaeodactylibacter sp.]|uniref:FAD:protein FMN transferase n=1 Tax=Phaeodactylibacter sp. TaxID=1940289 RepID=UPI0032ED30A5